MELKAEMLFNEFELIEKIGEGGQGAVWLARETFLDLKVALKILPKSFNDDKVAKTRFDREIKIQAKLNHPCIVKALKSGYANDHFYFAMDYVSGHTLDYYLTKGVLEERDSWKIALKVCEALDYAYREHQLIHRDIKPSNIIIDDEMNVFILDLGLSMATGNDTDLTQTGFLVGTPKYMSPEQIRDDELDCQTDIYSLGVTIYKMLCGRAPFESENVVQLIAKISLEQHKSIRTHSPELKWNTEIVLDMMLQKETQDRYPSWKILLLDINSLLDNREPVYAENKAKTDNYYIVKNIPEVALKNSAGIVEKEAQDINDLIERTEVRIISQSKEEDESSAATTIRKRKPIKVNMTDNAVGTQKYRRGGKTKRRQRAAPKKRSVVRVLIEICLAVLVGLAAVVVLYNEFYPDEGNIYSAADRDEQVNNQGSAHTNNPVAVTTDSALANYEANRTREQRLVEARRNAMLSEEAKRQQALRRRQLANNARIAELEAERARRRVIPVPATSIPVRQPIQQPVEIVNRKTGFHERGTYKLKKHWLTYKDAFYSMPEGTKASSAGWWLNNPFIASKKYAARSKAATYIFNQEITVTVNGTIGDAYTTNAYTRYTPVVFHAEQWKVNYHIMSKEKFFRGQAVSKDYILQSLRIYSDSKIIEITVGDIK